MTDPLAHSLGNVIGSGILSASWRPEGAQVRPLAAQTGRTLSGISVNFFGGGSTPTESAQENYFSVALKINDLGDFSVVLAVQEGF